MKRLMSIQYKIGLSLIFTSILFVAGCNMYCFTRPGKSIYWNLRKTDSSSNNNSVLINNFSDLTINQRIDVFLYAAGCVNDGRFEPILASGGQKIVPDIVRRIEIEPEMLDKANLVEVLIRVETKCSCVANDPEIIRRLESVRPSSSENDPFSQSFNDALDRLKKMTPTAAAKTSAGTRSINHRVVTRFSNT